jgi:hypothetical protein
VLMMVEILSLVGSDVNIATHLVIKVSSYNIYFLRGIHE